MHAAGPLSGEGPGLAGDHVGLRRLGGAENRLRAHPGPAGHEVTGPSVALQRGTGECWHMGETGVSMGRPERQGSPSSFCWRSAAVGTLSVPAAAPSPSETRASASGPTQPALCRSPWNPRAESLGLLGPRPLPPASPPEMPVAWNPCVYLPHPCLSQTCRGSHPPTPESKPHPGVRPSLV